MTDIKTIVLVEDNWAVLNERPSASGTTSDRRE
jgi:hypothetical protein